MYNTIETENKSINNYMDLQLIYQHFSRLVPSFVHALYPCFFSQLFLHAYVQLPKPLAYSPIKFVFSIVKLCSYKILFVMNTVLDL